MPGCNSGWLGWLAGLAGLAGWLVGWLAWLAGCSWLVDAAWLLMSVVPHARRQEVGAFANAEYVV